MILSGMPGPGLVARKKSQPELSIQATKLSRPGAIYDVQHSPYGLLLAEGQGWSLLNAGSFKLLHFQPASFCSSTRLSIAGSFVVPGAFSCNSSYKFPVWSLTKKRKIYYNAGWGPFQAQRLSQDGRRLGLARSDGVVRIMAVHAATGLQAGAGNVRSETKGADGTVFVQEQPDRDLHLRISDLQETGAQILVPEAFSPDLKLLAVRDWRDYYIRIYQLPEGRLLHRSEYYIPTFRPKLRFFRFSNSGTMYFDGRRLRSSLTGALKAQIPEDPDSILLQPAFSPQDSMLAVLRESQPTSHKIGQRYLQIFTLHTLLKASGRPINLTANWQKKIKVPADTISINFSLDSRRIWLGTFSGHLFFLDLPDA